MAYQVTIFLCTELWYAEKIKLNNWFEITSGEEKRCFRNQVKSKDWITSGKKAWEGPG